MSSVMLIAADKPLPLADCQEMRVYRKSGVSIALEAGFAVWEPVYYRKAVDDLGFAIKPFQYELSVENRETDWHALLRYLRDNLSPGESVELWSLWVGNGPGILRRYRGSLADFDMEAFGQLFEGDNLLENGQTCLTVTA